MYHFNSVRLVLGMALGVSATSKCLTKQLYEFPNSTWVENIAMRPNGNLVLTSPATNMLYLFDPRASEPSVALQIPNITSMTGIAEIAADEFVIAGAVVDATTGSFSDSHFFVVDFSRHTAVLKQTLPGLSSGFPNGLAALPSSHGVVLVADSIGGRIWRVDTRLETVEVVLEDPTLAPGNDRLGVNGLKIQGQYLYYTSSTTGVLGRVKISKDGRQFGPLEVVAELNIEGAWFDDFAIDPHGIIYAAVHPNTIERIWPNGTQEVLVGGNSTTLKVPTSVAISKNGRSIFVTTGGEEISGTVFGGQVVEVKI
jgi:hypothetical protein